MALAVAAYAAATLWASERYPGLLLGIGLIASHKLAWFITIAFGAATLIVSVDYVVTQMGILMTYLLFITAAALVVAIGLWVARVRSDRARRVR